MIKEFLTLRGIDQCLIIFFVMFMFSIITGLIITSRDDLEKRARRRLCRWIMKLEDWERGMLRDDEPFDASWMKYKEWRETRP